MPRSRMSKNEIEALWEKAMEGEPEPDKEITSADINQQTAARFAPIREV